MAKGFTLIELLIVIAILAILATTVVLTLNPAQLLAETRDSQRLSDLSTLQAAMSLYLANSTNPVMSYRGSCAAQCFSAIDGLGGGCAGTAAARHSSTNGGGATKDAVASSTASRVINGYGWVPVTFNAISGGAPFANLPIDPSNTATHFYSYACSNTNKTFEFDANMESTRYSSGSATDDKESRDGGDVDTIYEIGNDPGVDL